jgi:hypothetical protein
MFRIITPSREVDGGTFSTGTEGTATFLFDSQRFSASGFSNSFRVLALNTGSQEQSAYD